MEAGSAHNEFIRTVILPELAQLAKGRDATKADELIGLMLEKFPHPVDGTRFVRVTGPITLATLIALPDYEIPVAVTNAIMDLGVALRPVQGTHFWRLNERYVDALADDETVIDSIPDPEIAAVALPVPQAVPEVDPASDDPIGIEWEEQTLARRFYRARNRETGDVLAFGILYVQQKSASVWNALETKKLRADKENKSAVHEGIDHDRMVEIIAASAKV